jgi:hypothetical protein
MDSPNCAGMPRARVVRSALGGLRVRAGCLSDPCLQPSSFGEHRRTRSGVSAALARRCPLADHWVGKRASPVAWTYGAPVWVAPTNVSDAGERDAR